MQPCHSGIETLSLGNVTSYVEAGTPLPDLQAAPPSFQSLREFGTGLGGSLGEPFLIAPVSMYNRTIDIHWSHESHELARCMPERYDSYLSGLAFLRDPSGSPRPHG
ncbi:MAG: hypothetical protein LZF62_440024 [Nitrospira sp.]|nr:MAG: hypothetical protein LZF62_440024 [Nitrospira sp.]